MSNFSYNSLQNNSFTMTINRLPNTMFRVTNCIIPSITIPAAEAPFPTGDQYFPGSATEFDSLSIQFIVDENLKNYEEMFNWITQQRFAQKYKPKTDQEILLVSDGAVITMNNNSVPNRVFAFKDMFPIVLGPLNFDTSITQPESIICDVEFRFSYFELVGVNESSGGSSICHIG